MKAHDIIELGVVDSIGICILMIDLDASLKAVEILAGLSLISFNVFKMWQGYNNHKEKKKNG